MERLKGKTALVTGSSRGLGRAMAIGMAREGALVAVHYAHSEKGALETIELIEHEGGRAFAVGATLDKPSGIDDLFVGLRAGLEENTGRTVLDILVNNAAETLAAGTAPEEVSIEQFERLFAVNVTAPFFITQRAFELLPDGGRVINISSGTTRVAKPAQAAYAMTKGALEQLSRTFAPHLATRGITINSVAPGVTDNGSEVFNMPELVERLAQQSAFKRIGEPKDVADVVVFLATDEARWITGAFVDATGGSLLG